MLTFWHIQKELATNADIADSATRRDVADTHTTASDVRNDVVNARIIVSDIHHNTSKSPKDIGGQEEMVSATRILPVTESPLNATQPHARSATLTTN